MNLLLVSLGTEGEIVVLQSDERDRYTSIYIDGRLSPFCPFTASVS